MLSHTVPKKLLEHFAFNEPLTRSLRLWRYQKGRPPYGWAAPKVATRWDGHFADPMNAAKEAEIETRLEREFESPVNQFLDLLKYQTFPFTTSQKRLLTGYVTIVFHRSRARKAASGGQQNTMIDALRALRADENRLTQLAAKITMDLVSGGLRHMLPIDQAKSAIDNVIAEHTKGDVAQRGYLQTMETMMTFVDDRMRDGEWRILEAEPNKPFVIGDAPVVTWERIAADTLAFGVGFAQPNVEVLLPIYPTACLHLLPNVTRTRRVRTPSTDEVNRAQAAFATEHCFTNIQSTELDEALRPHFGTLQIGIDGFRIDVDAAQVLFNILMNQLGPTK
jgi:hypothetical protein